MKKNNEGFIQVIILILLALVLIGSAYYFGTQKGRLSLNPNPVSSPTASNPSVNPVTGPAVNWKTYTNTAWKYSFKYPPDWAVGSGTDVVSLMSDPAFLSKRENWDETTQGPFEDTFSDYGEITFSVYKKGVDTAAGMVNDQTDIRTFVNNLFGLKYDSVTDTTLGGQPAVEFVSDELVEKPGLPPHMQDCPPADAPCFIPSGRQIKQVWTKINGNLLYIVYSQGGTYKSIDQLPALFDQVLSTFKFTN